MQAFHTEHTDNHRHTGIESRAGQNLMRGVQFKLWDVSATDIEYHYADGHTISLYLKGGDTTYRHDKPDIKGQAGRLCIMPQGHISRWHSAEPIRIAHLYVPDQFIRQEAERHLDIDARQANLMDVIYRDDQDLSCQMMALVAGLSHQDRVDPLFCEQSLYALSSRLLENYQQQGVTGNAYQGGLSPSHRGFIKAYIRDHLDARLTLEHLAAQLNLSPFHFARMFKRSFGDTPASYIVRQRVEQSKLMLNNDLPLSHIALECGFTHQSHYHNYFKKLTGVTPLKYRKLLQV